MVTSCHTCTRIDRTPPPRLSPLHHSKTTPALSPDRDQILYPSSPASWNGRIKLHCRAYHLCQRLGLCPGDRRISPHVLLPCAASAYPARSWTPRKTRTRPSHVPSLDRRPHAGLSLPQQRLSRISRHRLDPCLPTARATYESPTPSPRPTGLAPRRLGTHPLLFRSTISLLVSPALVSTADGS